MKKIHLILVLIAINFALTAQNYQYKKYDWNPNPKLDTAAYDTSLHAVYLVKKMLKEFVYEKDELVEYYLIHRKVKLLTDKAVEEFNKTYIPQYKGSEVVIEKARFIKPNGELINLDKSSIKEGKDEDSGRKYRFFAFEGVEVGGEVEYFYVIKKSPYHYGLYYTAQSSTPSYNYSFDLFTPKNLVYKFKSYNQFPEIKLDTNYKDTNYWHVELKYIPELKKERISNYDNDLMAFIFKLHKNFATGAKDITSYGPWAKRVYNNVYTISKKQQKSIKKLIKEIKPDRSSLEKTIRSIEDYLKKNYTFYDISATELSDIESIYKNKAYNNTGSVFLYANILKNLKIKHELVVTYNRWDLRFDKDFEAYTFLNDYLFWFPELKKSLCPFDDYSRLGFPPQEYINNYGLFIKEVSMGDFSSGIGKIKFISAPEMDKTMNKLTVKVDFKDDFTKAKLNTIQEYTGYDAEYYQTVFELIQDEKKLKELQKNIVNIYGIDDEPENYEIINDKGSDFGFKPLIMKSEFITNHLTEKAGDTYVFKVGELIGPQMELYKTEEKRKENFEFQYNRKYHRDILIKIPSGYTVKNLDALKFNKTYKNKEGKIVFAFLSNYSIENDTIKITMDEWYDGIIYPKEIWDNYREVVNAAANFNKINQFFSIKK